MIVQRLVMWPGGASSRPSDRRETVERILLPSPALDLRVSVGNTVGDEAW